MADRRSIAGWWRTYRNADRSTRSAYRMLAFSLVNWPAAAIACSWSAGWNFDPFQQLMVFYSLAALAFAAVAAINAAGARSDRHATDS